MNARTQITPMNFPADFIDDTDGFRSTMILKCKMSCLLFIYLFVYLFLHKLWIFYLYWHNFSIVPVFISRGGSKILHMGSVNPTRGSVNHIFWKHPPSPKKIIMEKFYKLLLGRRAINSLKPESIPSTCQLHVWCGGGGGSVYNEVQVEQVPE